MIMRRSLSRPQQLREQLLQAIDAQNNIHNMAAVLDVIHCLEKYPMTKEALMETRLGKLINDVRKKSTDEHLVKRLKRLIRSWQRLSGVNEATEEELSCSANRGNSVRAKFISTSTQTFRTFDQVYVDHRAAKYDSVPGKTMNYFANVRRSKIPIRAINPYSTSLIPTKQSSASTSVGTLSNHPSQDHQDIIVRYLRKSQGHCACASQCSTKNLLVSGEPAMSTSTASQVPSSSSILDSHTKTDLVNNHRNVLKPTLNKVNLFPLTEVSNEVKETNDRSFENKTMKNQHSTFAIEHNEHHTEDNTKPAQQNISNITHDHHTQQIKSISYKTSNPHEDCQKMMTAENDVQGSEKLKMHTGFVQETNSQRRIIKPKLNFQNSLLTSHSQTSEMNLNLAEKLKKRNNDDVSECRRTNVFIPDFSVTDLQGISRDLTEKDIYRLHHQQWPGVNGCYDNRNNWYDWTQSITLDSYGDGSTLKISPYVCID